MRRSRPRRAVVPAAALAAGATLLAGCGMTAGTSSTGGAVVFKEVQSATIQIEAQGTFASPEDGNAYESAGLGSGFIISKDGIAVTNNHVVAGAGLLSVWVGGDTSDEVNAKVLGSSECLDLAVIQLTGKDYPFLAWHTAAPETADEVYAAGFPLGDPEFTMTKGIVSKAEADGESDWSSIDSVIEHDAKIRGGNSGGPLVAPDGTVVGVNYAGNDELDQNYAIAASEVQAVLEDLTSGENPLSLGVNAMALPPTDDGLAQGIWVNSVTSGGAADAIGVQPGDVLLSMEGVTLATEGTLAEYCDVLRTKGTDAVISVDVYRPSDDSYYTGEFNGTELAVFTVPGSTGDEGGSGSTEPFSTVSSDSGQVSVDVPARWGDVDGAPFTSATGDVWEGVAASSDLGAFYEGWTAGGMDVFASQTAAASYGVQDVLNEFRGSAAESCTLDNAAEYTDPVYTGQFEYYTDCGGTTSAFVVVAAADSANSHVIAVTAVLATPEDEAALSTILDTFLAGF
ncbi:MAG TPA: trypsin-like peptidase domain-containing protein [Naasia sp.]|jgi:serine protease Do